MRVGHLTLGTGAWSLARAWLDTIATHVPYEHHLLMRRLAIDTAQNTASPLDAPIGSQLDAPDAVAQMQRTHALVVEQAYGALYRRDVRAARLVLNSVAWPIEYPMSPYQAVDREWLLARCDVLEGFSAQAWGRLERLLNQHPDRGELWALAALLQPDQAESHWARSLACQPAQAETLVNRARARLRSGRLDEALADLRQALQIKPWLDAALQLQLSTLCQHGRAREALALAERSYRGRPSGHRAALLLDTARQAERSRQKLLAVVRPTLRAHAEDPEVQLAAGACWQAMGELVQAEAAYRARLQAVPDDVPASSNLGKLYYDRGQLEQAVAVWRHLGDTAPIEVRRNLAFALLDLGHHDDALQRIEAILAESPTDAYAHCGRAELALALGDLQTARVYLDRALAAANAWPRTWAVAFKLELAERGWNTAEATLLRGAETVPEPLALHRQLFGQWRDRDLLAQRASHIQKWLRTDPQEPAYLIMAAEVAFQANDADRADRLLADAQSLNWAEAASPRFRLLMKAGRYADAEAYARELVSRAPEQPDLRGFLAEVLARTGRHDAACSVLDESLALAGSQLELLRQKLGVLFAAGQRAQAVKAAWQAAEDAQDERYWRLLLDTCKQAGDKAEALRVCQARHAIGHATHYWTHELAQGLTHFGRRSEAVELLSRALDADPVNVKLAGALAGALQACERYDEAVAVMTRTLQTDASPSAAASIGELLLRAGEAEPALAIVRKAVTYYPRHMPLYRVWAAASFRLQDESGAAQAVSAALGNLEVAHVGPWALKQAVRLGQPDLVKPAFEAWREREPKAVEPLWALYEWTRAFGARGSATPLLLEIEAMRPGNPKVLRERIRNASDRWATTEAIVLARELCRIRPADPSNWGTLLIQMIKTGDFSEFDAIWQRMNQEYGQDRFLNYSRFFFDINCNPTWSAAEIFRYYDDWYRHYVAPRVGSPLPHYNLPDPGRRLRIAYISPDFRRHPVAYFSEPLLQFHDRQQFHLTAYAHLEPAEHDGYTARFKTYFDRWVDITTMSDDEMLRDIRQSGIDILIDLAGHTANNRLPLLLRRAAPVQASWIFGAGQTTGLREVDYLICDGHSVPADHEGFFSEQVIRLPQAGLPYAPPEDVPEPKPLPCLVTEVLTFGVLARPVRTNDPLFACWAEILKRVPHSVLRFDHVPYAEPDVQARITGTFVRLGIDPSRLVFRNTRPHWTAFHEIDIVLDPFPAGSGTTGTEALYMDRLVMTLNGRPPMGRIPASQVMALGLAKECMADSIDDYVAKTAKLALDRQRLAELSHDLRRRFASSYLMDYAQYGRDVATLYRNMWCAWCQRRASEG